MNFSRKCLSKWLQSVQNCFSCGTKTIRPFVEVFQAGCQNRVRRAEIQNLMKKSHLWLKEHPLFSVISASFSPYCRNFFSKVLETTLSVSKGIYGKPVPIEKIYFNQFRILTENCPAFCRSFFNWVVKSAFYVPGGTSWGKNTFK